MRTLAAAVALLLVAAVAPCAEDEAEPAGRTVTVGAVTGSVVARGTVDEPWKPVSEGDRLAEGADLMTGFRAGCILSTDDSLVGVEQITTLRIGDLSGEGKDLKTRFIVKRGSITFDVKEGVKSDFKISTPQKTLSRRGTRNGRVTHHDDTGSMYRFGGPGVVAVRGPYSIVELNPGQSTGDSLLLAVQHRHVEDLLKILDVFGFGSEEYLAFGRRNTMLPIPLSGLGGKTLGELGDEFRDLPPIVRPTKEKPKSSSSSSSDDSGSSNGSGNGEYLEGSCNH